MDYKKLTDLNYKHSLILDKNKTIKILKEELLNVEKSTHVISSYSIVRIHGQEVKINLVLQKEDLIKNIENRLYVQKNLLKKYEKEFKES